MSLEGLIGDNLCCKLMLETVLINILLNVKNVMSDYRNLSAKKNMLYSRSTDSQYNCNVYPAVLKIYIAKIIKIL